MNSRCKMLRGSFPGFLVLLGLVIIAAATQALAQSGTWETKAPMPTARYGMAAGVIGGKLYVAGGCCVFNAPPFPRFNGLEVYDPATDTWTTKAPMPIARDNLPAVEVINGVFYIIGGHNGSNFLSTVEAYDPARDAWTAKAAMPTARGFPGVGVINGILHAAGGQGDNAVQFNVLEVFAPSPSNQPPVALCKNVTVNTSVAVCSTPASVDNGSFDPDGDPITLPQSLAGPYSLGTTNVTLTVTDDKGASNSCTGMVTVVDNQAPTITCPVAQVIDATGPSGAVATFSPTVSDNCSGAIGVSCTPASGSTFPIGSTSVSCSATDGSGNSSSCAFTVTVTAAADQINNLIGTVETFNLKQGIANSLDSKLQNVLDALNAAREGAWGSPATNSTPSSTRRRLSRVNRLLWTRPIN